MWDGAFFASHRMVWKASAYGCVGKLGTAHTVRRQVWPIEKHSDRWRLQHIEAQIKSMR
jgi:hypothetical protein